MAKDFNVDDFKRAITAVKNRLPGMNPDHRLVVLDDIFEGYCTECGDELNRYGTCSCMRDE
mgnify:CR=1 FL=1|tara:strand:- start:429 stop:611 length:183 start_codon:yes stop_codon:yes gene_type:complete